VNNQFSNSGESITGVKDRTSSRIKHIVSVAYSQDVQTKPEKKFFSYLFGTLLDISDKGLCFKARGEFNIKNIISLYLKISDESRGIKMLGKVIWLKDSLEGECQIGVKFIGNLPPDWRKLIISEHSSAFNTA
jgi:PilZ domain-containing protein